MASDSTHNRKSNLVNSAQFGVSLFGAKTPDTVTVDCLTYLILTRNLQSIEDLLNGKSTSHTIQLEDGIKRQLDKYDPETRETPIFLAMQLQSDAVKDSMTPDATPANVTAVLLDNIQSLENYAKLNNLRHPTLKEIQAFANKLSNVDVGSVVSLMTANPELYSPGTTKTRG